MLTTRLVRLETWRSDDGTEFAGERPPVVLARRESDGFALVWHAPGHAKGVRLRAALALHGGGSGTPRYRILPIRRTAGGAAILSADRIAELTDAIDAFFGLSGVAWQVAQQLHARSRTPAKTVVVYDSMALFTRRK